ncbi:GNAT family N-acetyltransferase [Acerihabitans arboris]|uniref:GNAT family N-acetyltransferase n=1 Tax=Acerihabitans arboris TaxID=2691583 RepID=A0A845SRK6_9GAMM|nr:GNAT family N-acetyltransferase [Acerihabitans arboris]NDL65506.1 GNAT family N-acetyltransferase [Acerihabitans arboris]
MPIVIAPLVDHARHKELVIDWLWRAFGNGAGRGFYAAIVGSSLRREGLPITFIALDGDRPVGTVGLWRCDLLSRQDLTPWLAALYVDTDYRGQGLGRRLQAFVRDFSRRAGFANLYLYATFTGYYERHGWEPIGVGVEYPDMPVHIYQSRADAR